MPWILFLHDVRTPTNNVNAVVKAETKEELKAFVARETVAPYQDQPMAGPSPHQVQVFHKSFRKGGPLEWYDPPAHEHEQGHFKHMQPLADVLREQLEALTKSVTAQLTAQYKALITDLPEVPKS